MHGARFPLALAWLLHLAALTSCAPSEEREPPASAHEALRAGEFFDWWMPERFGARDASGRLLMRADAAYLRPQGYVVEFDACAPDEKQLATDFVWTIEGQTKYGCRQSHMFSGQGRYSVRLELRARGQRQRVVQQDVQVKDWFIAVLGDSYASGEGVPDVPSTVTGAAPIWLDTRCHRSEFAGPVAAALALETQDRRSSVTFVSLACSGATIFNTAPVGLVAAAQDEQRGAGLLQPYVGVEPGHDPPWSTSDYLHSQVSVLASLAGGRKIDAIVISAGGNDAGFADAIKQCVVVPDCTSDVLLITQLADHVTSLSARYDALATALTAIPHNRVLITEYPDPSRDQSGVTCSSLLDEIPVPLIVKTNSVAARELDFLRGALLTPLNAAIRAAVTRHADWAYVGGIASSFAAHGLCSANPFFVSPEQSVARQGPSDIAKTKGTLHPNGQGQAAIRTAILQTMQNVLPLSTFSVSTNMLEFAPVAVGSSSAPLEIVLSNTGLDQVRIDAIDPPFTSFTIVGNDCGSGLGANASCTLRVSFTPSSAAANTQDSLTIRSSAPGSPHIVWLSGRVRVPEPRMTPERAIFRPQLANSDSLPLQVELRNAGEDGLHIGDLEATSSEPARGVYSIVNHDCPVGRGTLAIGASCRVQLVFTSYGQLGMAPGELRVRSDAAQSWGFPLSAQVGVPRLITLPGPLTFSMQELETESAPESVTLLSSGSAPLTITHVGLAAGRDFVIDQDCPLAPAVLMPGDLCHVQVVFRPTRGGLRRNALQIESNAEGGLQNVPLEGRAPSLILAPAHALGLGAAPVGSTTAAVDLIARNDANAALTVHSVMITGSAAGEFQVVLDRCSATTLAPEQSCRLSLAFTPSAPGVRQAELTLTSSALEGPRSLSLQGVGNTGGALSVSPTSLTFAAPLETRATAQVIVTNPSSTAIKISGALVPSGRFSLARDGCQGVLQPSSQCTIDVTFEATSRSEQQGTLSASYDGGTLTIELRGTGASPEVLLPPSPLAFGTAVVGGSTDWHNVTLTNSGNAPLLVSAIRPPAGVVVRNESCTQVSIAPARTCGFQVRFEPLSAGALVDEIVVEANVLGGILRYPVAATGIPRP